MVYASNRFKHSETIVLLRVFFITVYEVRVVHHHTHACSHSHTGILYGQFKTTFVRGEREEEGEGMGVLDRILYVALKLLRSVSKCFF